jgi:hypothetical protein
MTKIAIEANPSGTGTFTIAAPNSNTNRTFALPDTAGGLVTDAQVNDGDNRIINGAFDFWQRGTSFTGLQYGSDRWLNSASGGIVTQSRQSHAVGDKFGVNSPQFFLRQAVSGQSAVGNFAVTHHRIESVRSYAGETITVLGWARRSSGSGNMAIEGDQFFGTGGSPSAFVIGISPTTITLTTSWTPFAAVITVPSISGKTLGTDGNDYLSINFWTSAGSDFSARTNSLGLQTIGVDLWGIHIKRGVYIAAATEFYKAPVLGPELSLCLRYFQRYTQPALRGVSGSSSGALRIGMTLPVVMRAVPAITVGALPVFDGTSVSAISSVNANYSTASVTEFDAIVSPANLGANRPVVVYQLGTTSLSLDAEL